MAYMSWVTPQKNGQTISGGNGNDTVSWVAQVHTGRVLRDCYATFSASGVESKTLHIIQSPTPEFVDVDDSASINKTGGTITISGWTNSTKLTFTLTGTNQIGLTLPATYTANGASTSNGAAIANDPGKDSKFQFSITFTNVAANTSITPKTSQLTVTDNAGNTDVCAITLAAGDAYLTISPTEITIPADGTAQSVSVSSNTSWSIS